MVLIELLAINANAGFEIRIFALFSADGSWPADRKGDRPSLSSSNLMAAAAVDPRAVCGVFWDYENVRVPRSVPTGQASNCIRDSLRRHGCGTLVAKRLYYDSHKPTEKNTDRVRLDLACGYWLVHKQQTTPCFRFPN